MLLIADLKQPWRFYYLITKPNFRVVAGMGHVHPDDLRRARDSVARLRLFTSAQFRARCRSRRRFSRSARACYSAFLFAQAKARDLWQSPVFIWHLLVQALIGGAAILIIAAASLSAGPGHDPYDSRAFCSLRWRLAW